MRKLWLLLFALVVTGLFVGGTSLSVLSAEVSKMTTDDLNSKLGTADLVILDVRGSWDWNKSDQKIANSIRVEPGAAQTWASEYSKTQDIVLYCA